MGSYNDIGEGIAFLFKALVVILLITVPLALYGGYALVQWALQ